MVGGVILSGIYGPGRYRRAGRVAAHLLRRRPAGLPGTARRFPAWSPRECLCCSGVAGVGPTPLPPPGHRGARRDGDRPGRFPRRS
ncbi:hypothetical protein ACRAWF_30235 [Streptomyces sp. L7]